MKYLYGAGRQDMRPVGCHVFLDWKLEGKNMPILPPMPFSCAVVLGYSLRKQW